MIPDSRWRGFRERRWRSRRSTTSPLAFPAKRGRDARSIYVALFRARAGIASLTTMATVTPCPDTLLSRFIQPDVQVMRSWVRSPAIVAGLAISAVDNAQTAQLI